MELQIYNLESNLTEDVSDRFPSLNGLIFFSEDITWYFPINKKETTISKMKNLGMSIYNEKPNYFPREIKFMRNGKEIKQKFHTSSIKSDVPINTWNIEYLLRRDPRNITDKIFPISRLCASCGTSTYDSRGRPLPINYVPLRCKNCKTLLSI